jgi:hypothetical protein
MTTELEEHFFKTFGIEPKIDYDYKTIIQDVVKTGFNINYPEITNDILLQMICILNETSCEVLSAENIEDLKNEILETCIKVYNTPILTSDGDEYENTVIYDKIQQLFKEEG